MVYTNLNRIQFGNGDVSVMVSMAGTRKEPQAMLVFQNREPTKIGRIDEDADLSRTKLGVYNPSKDIAMLFSKPESIDCVISALLAPSMAIPKPPSCRISYSGQVYIKPSARSATNP